MLDESQILNIVSQEISQAAGGNENDFVDANRQKALAAYLGQKTGREVEGRSSVVSTDVADAIEWILPEIVKAFTQNNDIVTFDACYDGDEDQAELESKYVYDILMKDNNGFLVLHQFIKDALMQKNGFLKVFYDNDVKTSTESYTGITDVELNLVLADEDVELLEQTTYFVEDIPVHDIKVQITKNASKVCVKAVPPEEFRVNKMHNSVDLSGARFTSHVVLRTTGELIEQGYDPELVEKIPSAAEYEEDREYRFYMQGETVEPGRDINLDPSLRYIEVSECYMRMDMDQDGVAELLKITVAGGEEPDVLLDVEPIDHIPFISATAILMSHKLFGLSIYDRLREIQDQKTTLWRNILDNMYLQNNQRTIVLDNQVNLDDLLVSRPGGIIRAKSRDAVTPYPTPALPSDAYKMMDYLDQVRAARSGVTPEGPIQDSMIGERVGSEGVEKMMNQREELVGLMVRVIAETGIKPLCYMIREEVVKHQDVARDYMYRGKWIKVDPTKWRDRSHSTVRVGTGSGNRKEQMAAVTQMIALQEKILANPSQSLVTENEVYKAADDFAKFAGLTGASRYLLDPQSPEGQQNKQQVQQSQQQQQQMQQQMEQAQAKAQADIANAEVQKAQAQMANVQLSNQNNQLKSQIDAQKAQADNEIKHLKQQLDEMSLLAKANKEDNDLGFKYWDAKQRHEIERERVEVQRVAANGRTDSNNSGD
jgi:hypothetical protein